MKALILYESLYGNTDKIAKAIAEGLRSSYKVTQIQIEDANPSDLENVDLLIVGSPTQGGRPGHGLQEFFKQLNSKSLIGIKAAAFDTRFDKNGHGTPLKLLMNALGFAAERICRLLQDKGATIITEPQGFIVTQKTGPLKKGEEKRARDWAREKFSL